MSRRVAAIGLDAAEWTLVERLLQEGELPHLSSLRERSLSARLHHADYRTGLVWEHFLTGRGAAGNRRWSAVDFDPATYGVVQTGGRRVVPFYANSSGDGEAGRHFTTIAFDVPYVTLTGNVDGAEVTSWGGHDPGYLKASRPSGLLREIEAKFGPHPGLNNDSEIVWYQPARLDEVADALVIGARRRADISVWLQQRFPEWHLFVTVLSEPHPAGEVMWHGVDPTHPAAATSAASQAGRRLREVYRAVDDAVGRISAALPADTTLVVFSMFGMGPNDADVASMVLLPELLHRRRFGRGLLPDPDQRAWRQAGFPPLIPHSQLEWGQHMKGLLPGNRRAKIKYRINRAMPAPLYEGIRAAQRARHERNHIRVGALGRPIEEETDLTPDEMGPNTQSVAWHIPSAYRPYWPKMAAFALPTFYDGRVRINLKGRERDGVVDLDDYRKACLDIERLVRECRNPRTGKKAVADVAFLRADDPMAPDGAEADVQIVWAGIADAIDHPEIGTIGPFPYRRTGGHSPNGFMFLAGPGIDAGDLGQRDALDVTPTILSLMGRDIPADLEGSAVIAPIAGPAS